MNQAAPETEPGHAANAAATTVSLLHCSRKKRANRVHPEFCATKMWAPSLGDRPMCLNFSAGRYFYCEPYPVSGIYELGKVLFKLERRPDICVIRGFPAPGVDLSQQVRRMKRPDSKGKTWFVERAGQPWVLLDIDKKPVPPEIDPVRDPKAAMSYLVENCVPPYLRDVTFVGQWSSSTGMKGPGLLSAHLWFWLDRPMTEVELKTWYFADSWLRDHEHHIDPTLFRLVQIHYTAAPIFEGVTDPLPRRTGIKKGAKDVASLPIPEHAEATASPRSRSRPSGHQSAGASGSNYDVLSNTRGFDAKLALIGDGTTADGIHLQGFHRVITAAAASYASAHGKTFDRNELKEILRGAINAAPKHAGREGDIVGYLGDEYLDSAIGSAIERFGEEAGAEESDAGSIFEDTDLIDGIPPAFP
ncbi:MAG: hypothetical protein ACREFD_07435 [Stellaceae bacterium]